MIFWVRVWKSQRGISKPKTYPFPERVQVVYGVRGDYFSDDGNYIISGIGIGKSSIREKSSGP